jgi:lipid-A-disaccharide synthase
LLCVLCDLVVDFQMNHLRFLIVAGEASGDAHAASLMRAIQVIASPNQIEFFGATGSRMRQAGADSVVRSDELAILGLWEIGTALPRFWDAYRKLKRATTERKPAAAILIDWPDFNLRLARWLHQRGIPVIYYVSPQLWAWRSHRARNLQRDVDLLLSILPFEKEWYAARGMTHVEYVGHPLAGEVRPAYDRDEFCRRNNLDSSRPIVALLPGSRHKELVRILPPMLAAANRISRERSEIQFVLVVAPNRDPREAEQIVDASKDSPHASTAVRIIHHQTGEALAAADAAAVASGTATLEAALLGTPMVIVYKESFLNWHILGRMITTDHYGLVNLIAGKRVARELIQNDFSAKSLADELLSLLDSQRNASLRVQLREVSEKVGAAGASERAARAVMEFISR